MGRLKLSDWSEIADIVAGVAVVVSLIFVGLQVADNTEALRSQNERALVNALEKLELNRVRDVEFADLMLRAETGGELSPLDLSRLEALGYLYLDNWEQAFHDQQKGLMDPDIWRALDNWLRGRLKFAYFGDIAAAAAESDTYAADFTAHLRKALAEQNSGAN